MKTPTDDVGQDIINILNNNDLTMESVAIILGTVIGTCAAVVERHSSGAGDEFRVVAAGAMNETYSFIRNIPSKVH